MESVLKLKSRILLLLLLFVGALFFAGRASAQRGPGDEAKAAATLQPEARAVISRLSGMRNLPDGAWKLHEGDLAHGEAVGVDESTWTPVTASTKASADAVITGSMAHDWSEASVTMIDTESGESVLRAVLKPKDPKRKAFASPDEVVLEALRVFAALFQ